MILSNVIPIGKIQQFIATSRKGNNLWKSSFYIMVSQSVSVVLFLVADALFARRFTTIDFATWKQVTLLINLGIPLISFGLPEGFKYFAAKEPQQVGVHLIRSIAATTIISVVILAFMYLGGSQMLVKVLKYNKISVEV